MDEISEMVEADNAKAKKQLRLRQYTSYYRIDFCVCRAGSYPPSVFEGLRFHKVIQMFCFIAIVFIRNFLKFKKHE